MIKPSNTIKHRDHSAMNQNLGWLGYRWWGGLVRLEQMFWQQQGSERPENTSWKSNYTSMSRIPDCPRSAHFGWAAYVVRCDACSRHGVQKEQGALPFISWTQPGVHPFIGLSSHLHNLRPFGGNATFWETPVWLKYGHGYAVTYIFVWCLFSVGRYPSDPNVSLLPSGKWPEAHI